MRVYLCILVLFLLSCENDDEITYTPTCRLISYSSIQILAHYSDSEENLRFHELVYIDDVLVKRINNGFGSKDTLIYENGRLKEIRRHYQAPQLDFKHIYFYENNRISGYDTYNFSVESNDWILTTKAKRLYDDSGKIIGFTFRSADIGYPHTITKIEITYEGNNLSKAVSKFYKVINEQDTIPQGTQTGTYLDYDDKINPLKGQIFNDTFYRSLSENNFQKHHVTSTDTLGVIRENEWSFELTYDEYQNPKIGKYECK